jgi:hypothetical protein
MSGEGKKENQKHYGADYCISDVPEIELDFRHQPGIQDSKNGIKKDPQHRSDSYLEQRCGKIVIPKGLFKFPGKGQCQVINLNVI